MTTSRAISIFQQLDLLFRRNTPRQTRRKRQTTSTVRRSQSSTTSDEFLRNVWVNLRTEYFPDRPELDTYIVTWSSRSQKRVLASCNIRQRKVVVARELFEPSACRWISAVLYHELCHAVIGEDVHTFRGKRQWHGPQFRTLEARHPDIRALNSWIRTGGWAMAVRSNRARRGWQSRRSATK